MWTLLKSVLATVILVGLAMPVRGDVLNEEQFTKLFVKRVGERSDEFGFTYPERLVVHVHDKNKEVNIVFLGNAYRDYLAVPQDLSNIIDDHAALAVRSFMTEIPLDKPVLPVLRALEMFTHDQPDALSTDDLGMLHIKLTDEVGIFFVVSNNGEMIYLHNKDVSARNLKTAALFEQSLEAVKQLKHGAKIEAGDDFAIVEGDVYTTSLLLLDHFWQKVPLNFKGRRVVFPVSRTLFIITGDEEVSGLETSRKLAKELFDELSYPISDKPIVFDGKDWRSLD